MSAATTLHLDLTAPPIVGKISRRSLVVGVVFSVIAVVIALVLPNGREEFFRAYLLGFMLWLGVALGSMAILMIRHLTGGGWGTVTLAGVTVVESRLSGTSSAVTVASTWP